MEAGELSEAKVTPIELDTKPVPVTAMVNPSLPAVMTEGNRSVTVGVGLKGTELPPHPAKTKLAATDSSATQRERFKTSLLVSFKRGSRSRLAPAPGNAERGTQQTVCKSPAD